MEKIEKNSNLPTLSPEGSLNSYLLKKLLNEPSFENREQIFTQIEDLEHKNDDLTHKIFTELSRNFITPFDREDIHYLASSLDDIADYIFASAKKINFYRVDPMQGNFRKMGDLICQGTENIKNAITELRNMKNMRSDFIANASHELRTPLVSLKGFLETISDSAKDDPSSQKKFINIMKEEAGKMERLLDDLMSLSRIELQEHISVTGSEGKVESFLPSLELRYGKRSAVGNFKQWSHDASKPKVESRKVWDESIKYNGFHYGASYLEHLKISSFTR